MSTRGGTCHHRTVPLVSTSSPPPTAGPRGRLHGRRRAALSLLALCAAAARAPGCAAAVARPGCGKIGEAIILTSDKEVSDFARWGTTWGPSSWHLRGTPPGPCEVVRGDLLITGGGVASLAPLGELSILDGYLAITDTSITSLEGLGNITDIANSLEISGNRHLAFVSGLAKLSTVGAKASFVNNAALESLDGMVNLWKIGGMTVKSNPILGSLGMPQLQHIVGDLRIEQNAMLKSLAGFGELEHIWGRLTVLETPLRVVGTFDHTVRVMSMDFDDASWPACITQEERAGLAAMCNQPSKSKLGPATTTRWQQHHCGAEPVSCYWGTSCSARLITSPDASSADLVAEGTLVALSRADALCGACDGRPNATVGPKGLVSFGHKLNDERPGRYSLCRCSPGATVGSVGPVAGFLLRGPLGGSNVKCNLDLGCDFSLAHGSVGLLSGDEVHVMTSCKYDEGTEELAIPAILKNGNGNMKFQFTNVSQLMTLEPNLYKLCWKVPCGAAPGCADHSNFIDIGDFTIPGPFRYPQWVTQGLIFTSSNQGFEVSSNDKMMLLRECGQADVAELGYVEANSSKDMSFNFGKLSASDVRAVEYRKCWCQPVPGSGLHCSSPEDFRTDAGPVHILCPPGFDDKDGNGLCSPCRSGFYKDSAGPQACTACPVGHSSETGSSNCTRCPPGQFSNLSMPSCRPCGPGEHPSTMQNECVTCPPGHISSPGEPTCIPCPPGRIATADGGHCRACKTGQYSAPEQTTCLLCPRGHFSSAGSDNCTMCPPGHVSTGGSGNCSICNVGEYAPPGSGSCLTCAPGHFSLAGSSNCTPCSVGEIAPAGSSKCMACGAGTYASEEQSMCVACVAGRFSSSGEAVCHRCTAHSISSPGSSSCNECSVWEVANSRQTQCVRGSRYLFIYIAYMALLVVAFLSTFLTIRREIRIVDVSVHDGRCFVRTCRAHHLHRLLCKKMFPVNFSGTRHPLLDTPKKQFYARVNLANELELFDNDGCPFGESVDTSRGVVSLAFPHEFLHTGFIFPAAFWIPLVSIIAMSLALLNLNPGHARYGATYCFVAALGLALVRRHIVQKTPLDRLLDEYQLKLKADGWGPAPCPRGPQRAIAVGKLLDVHAYFRSYIRNRTAYYMDGNILRPLTHSTQLSFAELVGPSQVQWFCSHYWGTPFTNFCESLRSHAMTRAQMEPSLPSPGETSLMSPTLNSFAGPTRSSFESDRCWSDTAYWVCFCSINQYNIPEELGDSWRESSFFITLQSGFCKGTCMVLDTAATPLTRSWCIFELLQTLKLEGQDNFIGLELGTATGLLNEGQSSVEVAVNLVKRMATLDLEAANASNQQDKMMINSLVVEEMGSFDHMNAYMQKEIRRVLTKAQSKFSTQFARMYTLLDTIDTLTRDSEKERHKLLLTSFLAWKMGRGELTKGQQACMPSAIEMLTSSQASAHV